jgi:hypothetical protein
LKSTGVGCIQNPHAIQPIPAIMKTLVIALLISGLHFTATANDNLQKKSSNRFSKSEIITPSHPALHASDITENNQNYILYTELENKQRELVGLYSSEVKKITVNQKTDIRVKNQLVRANGKEETVVTMLTEKSLKPRYVINKDDVATTLLSYSENGVEGQVLMNSISATFQENHSVPAFDEGSIDILVQALPLETGYQATFWTYSGNDSNSLNVQNLEVLQETQAKINNDHSVSVWVVQVSNQVKTTTYTIDRTNKSILKRIEVLPSGKKLVMEKI